jgi:formylglycine-generating enzyme required for sulfatase activity
VDLVDIPAGAFLMGSADDDREARASEKPQHPVAVAAFRLMRTPVTRRLYREIMGNDPGWPGGEADDRPVNAVTWYDAVRFCNALSTKEGLIPCYRFAGEHSVSRDPAGNGYRLPSEAEWEYACRAGTTTRYFFGDDARVLGDYAWFSGNSGSAPQPVGRKWPNLWGLYDMHGNVWEWVEDCWHESYAGAPADGSAWVSGDCTGRVLRGGAFNYVPRDLRSAIRGRYVPEDGDGNVGFRCARAPRRQP